MYAELLKKMQAGFDQIILKLKDDFANIRTGRASTALVENIIVSYYGSNTPIKQMASLSTPDSTQIVIQPWDKNDLGDIEIAIRNSDVGIEPTNDGSVVRLSLPSMTQERREELVRNISKKGEEGRIALRNVRGEAWEKIKKLEKDDQITEDDKYTAEKEINELIDDYNKKIEETVKNKESELRTI
jgi:ribosome recycling factor